MNYRAPIVASFFLATAMACHREISNNPPVVPPGISWASMVSDAVDLRTLAMPVETGALSRMFSSCKDLGKVMLATLAPRILGDMDHGFFTEVVDDKDGVRATLAEFDGPGAVTWIWSANPVVTLGLFIDGKEMPAARATCPANTGRFENERPSIRRRHNAQDDGL